MGGRALTQPREPQPAQLFRFLDRLDRRRRAVRALERGLGSACFAVLIVLLVRALELAGALPAGSALTSVLLGGLFILLFAGQAWLARPDRASAANLADRRAELHDLLKTAVEVTEQPPGAWSALVIDQASGCASQLDSARLVPAPRLGLRAAAVLALLALPVAWMLLPRLSQQAKQLLPAFFTEPAGAEASPEQAAASPLREAGTTSRSRGAGLSPEAEAAALAALAAGAIEGINEARASDGKPGENADGTSEGEAAGDSAQAGRARPLSADSTTTGSPLAEPPRSSDLLTELQRDLAEALRAQRGEPVSRTGESAPGEVPSGRATSRESREKGAGEDAQGRAAATAEMRAAEAQRLERSAQPHSGAESAPFGEGVAMSGAVLDQLASERSPDGATASDATGPQAGEAPVFGDDGDLLEGPVALETALVHAREQERLRLQTEPRELPSPAQPARLEYREAGAVESGGTSSWVDSRPVPWRHRASVSRFFPADPEDTDSTGNAQSNQEQSSPDQEGPRRDDDRR